MIKSRYRSRRPVARTRTRGYTHNPNPWAEFDRQRGIEDYVPRRAALAGGGLAGLDQTRRFAMAEDMSPLDMQRILAQEAHDRQMQMEYARQRQQVDMAYLQHLAQQAQAANMWRAQVAEKKRMESEAFKNEQHKQRWDPQYRAELTAKQQANEANRLKLDRIKQQGPLTEYESQSGITGLNKTLRGETPDSFEAASLQRIMPPEQIAKILAERMRGQNAMEKQGAIDARQQDKMEMKGSLAKWLGNVQKTYSDNLDLKKGPIYTDPATKIKYPQMPHGQFYLQGRAELESDPSPLARQIRDAARAVSPDDQAYGAKLDEIIRNMYWGSPWQDVVRPKAPGQQSALPDQQGMAMAGLPPVQGSPGMDVTGNNAPAIPGGFYGQIASQPRQHRELIPNIDVTKERGYLDPETTTPDQLMAALNQPQQQVAMSLPWASPLMQGSPDVDQIMTDERQEYLRKNRQQPPALLPDDEGYFFQPPTPAGILPWWAEEDSSMWG